MTRLLARLEDFRLLPIFVVMFIVNYVDRVNVSFIKPQLEASLGIGATAYGLGAEGTAIVVHAHLRAALDAALTRVERMQVHLRRAEARAAVRIADSAVST